MIRKSGYRFPKKIMLKQKDRAGWRFEEKSSRSRRGAPPWDPRCPVPEYGRRGATQRSEAAMIGNACLNSANECGKTVFLRPAPTAIRCGMLWSSCLKEGLADVDDRFSASSDTARDLQHHRLPDARRFLYRSGSEADADVGRRVAADAERYVAGARYSDAVVRGHQGRASGREIPHRSFVVADRVRRRGGRISAMAAVRQLNLFLADNAGFGGFPFGHRLAGAARNAGDIRPRCGRGAGQASFRCRTPTAIRSRTRAVRTGSGCRRRIRAAGSPPAENPAF